VSPIIGTGVAANKRCEKPPPSNSQGWRTRLPHSRIFGSLTERPEAARLHRQQVSRRRQQVALATA